MPGTHCSKHFKYFVTLFDLPRNPLDRNRYYPSFYTKENGGSELSMVTQRGRGSVETGIRSHAFDHLCECMCP